jgi:hypothetical protein
MSKLVAGERAGAAALALRLQLDAVGAELTAHYDRCKRAGSVEGAAAADRLALGHLWMLHQDLLGYALLGDPAVRLPPANRERARASPSEPPAAADPPHPGPGSRGEGHRDVDVGVLDRLERAVLAVASGDSPGAIAVQLGVPRSELVEAAEVYRDAGRAALARLLQRRDHDGGSR